MAEQSVNGMQTTEGVWGNSDFSAIYANLPWMILLLDENLCVVKANHAAANFLRSTPNALAGMPCQAALGCSPAQTHTDGVSPLVDGGDCQILSLVRDTLHTGVAHSRHDAQLRRANARPSLALVQVSTQRLIMAGQPHVLLTLEDITERIQTWDALVREAVINAQMAEVAKLMLMVESIADAAHIILQAALHLTHSAIGLVGHVESFGGRLVFSEVTGLERWPYLCKDPIEIGSEWIAWNQSNKRGFFSNDPPHDVMLNTLPAACRELHSFMALPALYGDTLIGMILLAEAENGYRAEDRMNVENLATLLALGLQRKLAEEETKRHVNELATLQQVSNAMREANSREEILPVILAQVECLFHTGGSAIGLYNYENDGFDSLTGNGLWQNQSHLERLSQSQVSHKVALSKRPYVCNAPATIPDCHQASFPGPSFNSTCCLPLKTRDLPVGVLWLGRQEPFDENEIRLLESLGDMTAIALHRQSLHQDLQQQLVMQQKTHARLVQSEKLAALGELTAGVAHELNNPLTAILLYADLLQQRPLDAETTADLEKIAVEARRSAKIVRGLLDFSHQRAPERKPLQVNDILRRSLELIRYELSSHGVEWVFDLSADIPMTMADPHQLQQVFINLLTNAWHALNTVERKGHLTIRTRLAAQAAISHGKGGPAVIQIAIEDNGPGIMPDAQKRVFDPFFTTKPEGQGSGLGLSICHGIITEHGGNIWVESQPGLGATFFIELPVVLPVTREPADRPEQQEARQHENTGRILLIDDEPMVLEIVARIIRRANHRVDVADSGLKGLEWLAKTPYDLILCDIHMPQLNGIKFYRLIEAEYPHLRRRIVFTTGDSISHSTQAFLDEVGLPFLRKPFEKEDLLALIDRHLALL
jgi:signal transduction histidine kinase/ActR/RegA family two-component response regulator